MNSESRHQQSLIQWASYAAAARPELNLLYAIPNGADCTSKNRLRLVCEGLKKGIPDLCLPVPRGNSASLYIELKTPKGRLSKHQEAMILLLEAYGNKVIVSRSLTDTIEQIEKYLDNSIG